jgi:Predicted nucleotide-binding protein containing TIR-like domain
MSELVNELQAIYEEMQSVAQTFDKPDFLKPLGALEDSANEAGKAWGHSWLGYQSRVYYAELQPPPPGAHFSTEWGLKELYTMGTRGRWVEFAEDIVETEIRRRAGNPDISKAQKVCEKAMQTLQRKRDDVISILRTAQGRQEDSLLARLLQETEETKALTASDFINYMRPSGQIMTRDMIAMSQGLWIPPHISVLAEVLSIKAPKAAFESLANIARRAFSHLERIEKKHAKADRIGTNVAIGHGRSKEWKDLKDFINDRTRLPWDEFNRVAVAGIPNAVRLSTMLDAAVIAFLVLTAEDERADGKMQARMNVIHEAGLFQGRLGFSRAIVMLEEGCEEFSNIEGLGQIRFPKNNIKAAFHDVQLVLEREGLVEAPASYSPQTPISSTGSEQEQQLARQP